MSESKSVTQAEPSIIPGLIYIPDFITRDEEILLLKEIKSEYKWDTTLSRRTAQFGFKYDYSRSTKPEPIRPFTTKIAELVNKIIIRLTKIMSNDLVESKKSNNNRTLEQDLEFDQCIVNEYLPGQGITPHVDHAEYFGGIIASLTVNSGCVMSFKPSTKYNNSRQSDKSNVKNVKKDISFYLEPRSLVVLTGESRYGWTHEIPKKKNDDITNVSNVKIDKINSKNKTIPRGTRYSYTVRTVL